jgi:hypothetical protein
MAKDKIQKIYKMERDRLLASGCCLSVADAGAVGFIYREHYGLIDHFHLEARNGVLHFTPVASVGGREALMIPKRREPITELSLR